MNEEIRALRTLAAVLLVSGTLRLAWQSRVGEGVEAGTEVSVEELADSAERVEAAEALRSSPLGPDERIDPNTADEVTLDRLPGIGPALARRWIAERSDSAPFRSPEDLLRISGVGPSTLERIRPLLAPRPWRRPGRRPGSLPLAGNGR